MEFTALFILLLFAMAGAWWGSRSIALVIFTIALFASMATYVHHATDTLPLSF